MTEQPNILRIIEQQRSALLRGDAAALRLHAERWQQIEDALLDRAELLARDIAERKARGEVISDARLFQLQRYQVLISQTQKEIARYVDGMLPGAVARQDALRALGQSNAIELLGVVIPSFTRLPVASTDVMIATAADGSPLRDLFLRTWPDAAEAMTRALIESTALGVNPRTTARQMTTATQSSLRRMLTIARTEQLRAYREASRGTYARSGVVQRYRRIAAKQSRTCPLCLGLDGTEYSINQIMPSHPNCRCSLVPLIDGYRINWGRTGEEWFARQSEETQRDMLGRARYQLYRDGKIALRDLAVVENNSDWGPTLRAKTIAELT